MSSLADLIKAAQSFLDPTSTNALISFTTMKEWLRPLYNFGDGVTSVGSPWEIHRTKLPFGRVVDEYIKRGAISSQFTSFTIVPSHSFAVIVLTSGKKNVADELHRRVMDHFLPAFDQALTQATEEHLAGVWKDPKGDVELQLLVEAGKLVATRYSVNRSDALESLTDGEKTSRMPLWYMGNDELRLLPSSIGGLYSDCLYGWMSLDDSVYLNGYAVNLLRVLHHESDPNRNRLDVPALQVTLHRH